VTAKEGIVIMERLLLHVLEYDFDVELPWPHMRRLGDALGVPEGVTKLAMKAANDIVRTTLTLQYAPEELAQGALLVAARFSQWRPPREKLVGVVTLSAAAEADIWEQFCKWQAVGKALAQQAQGGGAATAAAAPGAPAAAGGGSGAPAAAAGAPQAGAAAADVTMADGTGGRGGAAPAVQ
jgi:hypothetical protein